MEDRVGENEYPDSLLASNWNRRHRLGGTNETREDPASFRAPTVVLAVAVGEAQGDHG